ncbi:MAG: hypothetical protein AMS24_02535 [Chlamydiae bacterium SM23_39]|nr:MAG: hypothetical protein AMS24_02535 [Chlamydiae bacterium SM23_39]
MQLFSPHKILKRYPLSKKNKNFIYYSRKKAKKIYFQKTKKIILFVGPCSIHDKDSALEYAKKLNIFSKKVKKNFFIIMRFFYEKARSSIGWKGFLYDPNIKKGIEETRKLMLRLTELKIPLASEILDPNLKYYFEDLLTWGFIGSRSSTSQIHRQIASSFSFPIGIKNCLNGDIKTSIDSIISAQSKHSYISISKKGKISSFNSSGNIYSHIVLRGSEKKPNFYPQIIKNFLKEIEKRKIYSPLVIDAAHGNSKKNLKNQKECFKKIIYQIPKNKKIIGIMIESFLKRGNQKIYKKKTINKKKSITDPCLGWKETTKLIFWANNYLLNNYFNN